MNDNGRNNLDKIVENSDEEHKEKSNWKKLILLEKSSKDYLQNDDSDNAKDDGFDDENNSNTDESIQNDIFYNDQILLKDDNLPVPISQNYIDVNTAMSLFVLDKSKTLLLNNNNNNPYTNDENTMYQKYLLEFLSITSDGCISVNANGRKIYSIIENETTTSFLLPTPTNWKCCFKLPYGFEAAINSSGGLYFINYNNSSTTNSIDLDEIVYSGKPIYVLENFAPSKITTTITINDHLSRLDWGYIIDNHCQIIKSIPPNPNGTLMENCLLVKKFKIGDRIISINNIHVKCVDDIKNSFKHAINPMNIEMIREFKIKSVDSSSSVLSRNYSSFKPAILSEMRKANNKLNKISVHFAEKPVILEYQREIVKKQTENNTIETKYDNLIRIKLETGMVKTIKVSNNHTVYNVIEKVMGRLNYQHLEIFCLALVDSAQCHVHYFSHHQKMEKIFKYKKNDVTLECRILILHPSDDVKTWLTPEWISCFDYLFFQYRNELLTGNVVKNDVMNEKTLLHLIGFVVATDNMVECLNKLEMYVDKKHRDQTVDNVCLDGIGNLVIPSSFLANVDYRIKYLCKSISAASLNEHVMTIFSDLLPQPFFQLIFAETKQLDDIQFSISNPVFNEFKYITHNAQLAFLQLAIQFNLVGTQRFRVHVIKCPGVQISDSSLSGLPFHFFIDFHSGYGITKDTSNFTMLVGDFNSVLAIYVYFNGDGRRVISILSKRESPIIFIANERECDNIIVFLRSICSMKSDEYQCKTSSANQNNYLLPVIDFTDITCRVSNTDLPPFFDYNHLTIPSNWNYNCSVEEFTTQFWPYFKRFSPSSPTNQASKFNDSTTDSDIVSYEILSNKIDISAEKVIYEKIDALLPYLIRLKRGYISSISSTINPYHSMNTNNYPHIDYCDEEEEEDDDECESLSKNPWIQKLVNADEVDIRRKNSFSKIYQRNENFHKSSTESSQEPTSETIDSFRESTCNRSQQSDTDSLQPQLDVDADADAEEDPTQVPCEEICDDNKDNCADSSIIIDAEQNQETGTKNCDLSRDGGISTRSSRLSITSKLLRALSRIKKKPKNDFVSRKKL